MECLRDLFQNIAKRFAEAFRMQMRNQVRSVLRRLCSQQIQARYPSFSWAMEGLWVRTTVFMDIKVSFALKFKSEEKWNGPTMDF